jgi:hypothetical protein
MVTEAASRAADAGLADRCRFIAQDLAELDIDGRFRLIISVTVLQHILDEQRLEQAINRLAKHLAPNGTMILLEAAPTRATSRCDSPVFRARGLDTYLTLFDRCRLIVEAVTGVDPMPLKTRFLPHYAILPKPIALAGLAAVTALALPVDVLLGRRLMKQSWHKVFVLKHAPAILK